VEKNAIMKKRKLGNTDLYLSELGYGCASLWSKPRFTTDEQAEELFKSAYDHGINFFDTGHSYGVSEKRLGHYIHDLGKGKRQELILSTKCGTRYDKSKGYYHDWSVEWMQKSVEISLKRLHTDYIDLLQLHGPTVSEISDEMFTWLDKLKEKGIIRAAGINTFDTDVIEYVCKNKLFDAVMLDYNIMRQDREETIIELYDAGIGVIAGAPLAQSLYSNRVWKVRSMRDAWYLLRALKNSHRQMIYGRQFRFINDVPGYSANQLAIRYVLNNDKVTTAVFGTVTPEHLVENIGAVDIEMPENVWKQIKSKKKMASALDRR